MRLTNAELDAINAALSELLAGEGPQGYEDENEAQRIMDAGENAQRKIHDEIEKRARPSQKKTRHARHAASRHEYMFECIDCAERLSVECDTGKGDDCAVAVYHWRKTPGDFWRCATCAQRRQDRAAK